MAALRDTHFEHAANSTTVRIVERPPALRAATTAVRWLGGASPEVAALAAARMFGTPQRRPRPAREHEILERAHRRLSVPFGDAQLAAWEWGEAGPRVLLIHGWAGRAAQLGEMIEPLVALGFRVVGFDAPAHGDSSGTTTHFLQFVRAAAAVVDHLGGAQFHAVIGHSMGGAVMGWLARERPIAKRYVAIAPPRALSDFARQMEDTLQMEPRVREAFERRLDRVLGVPLVSIRSDVEGAPRAPLLVVHDEGDREIPIAAGETLARHWPGAVMHRTTGLGHQRILRDAAVIEHVRRFVAWGVTP